MNAPSAPADVAAATITQPRTRLVAWPLLVAPLLSGCLIAAPFLNFGLYPLGWIAFAPLLWAFDRARTHREIIIAATIAGAVTNVLGFHWLVYTINVFGSFPLVLALIVFAFWAAYSAGQFVLFGLAFRRVGWGPIGIAPALIWVALEFLYPNMFPWRLAHSQHHVIPLIQIGDLTGPYGLSLVLVWASAATVLSARRQLAPAAGVAIAVTAVVAYGLIRIPAIEAAMAAARSAQIALVQGNVGIYEKGDVRSFDINIDHYRRQTAVVQDSVALAIWPESVSQDWVREGTRLLEPNHHPFPALRTHLIYGGLAFLQTGPQEADEYNSAFLIDAPGNVLDRYDKQILMPFGEYIPLASRFPIIRRLSPRTAGFTAGTQSRVFDVPGVGAVGPLICFEDIAAGIPRAMTLAGAEILVAMANDAWYGESAAPYEHQALALWRAIENRRYLLRVNNSGVTGVIDPLGRVTQTLPIFTENVLVASVQPLQVPSPYTRWGDSFGWLVTAATVILLVRRHPGHTEHG